MSSKTYITTTIPYVNARPHIGFALELVQADVIARYYRLLKKETRFQTGTDENALKNVLTAHELSVPVNELVANNYRSFTDLADRLNISINHFQRTTDEVHKNAVHWFWRQLNPKDIYIKNYSGLYCSGCEDFFLEKDLVQGKCPDHGKRPVMVNENNYFFGLSGYQERLQDLIISDEIKIIPETRKNEVLEFVKRGLKDISISRSADRFDGWGINVPDDNSQVVYVWIDALINYLSGLGYGISGNWHDFWDRDVLKIHCIGKNVWKFHAVYWPALLLSAGLGLPDIIFVHGFLTEGGKKISKSSGNSIDPITYIDEYGVDSIRYYLLRGFSPFEDGDFSLERLKQFHNSDLANNLGNLLSRLTALCQKAEFEYFNRPDNVQAPSGLHEAITSFEFDKALKLIWHNLAWINRDIDEKQPWKDLKIGRAEQLKKYLTIWLDKLYEVGYWLSPFMPETTEKIKDTLTRVPIYASAPLFNRLTTFS